MNPLTRLAHTLRHKWHAATPLARVALIAALLLLLAAIVAGPAMRMYSTFTDTQRCSDGGCADELPGRWSDGERTLTLDSDGTFIARVEGRTMRGTWTATDYQICFVSAGDRECMEYQYMGEILQLDEAIYYRR